MAADTGVHFAGVKYDDKDAPIEGLRKMNDRDLAFRRLPAGSEVHQSTGARQNVLPDRWHRAGRAAGQCSPATEAGNVFAQRGGNIVKLGTENRTKTIIAAVLLIVAVVLVVRAFRGGDEEPPPAPAPAAAARPAPDSSDWASCARRRKNRAQAALRCWPRRSIPPCASTC